MSDALTLTVVFTLDENGWVMAQLAAWPDIVTCGPSVKEARAMLFDAARQMIASYHDEGRDPRSAAATPNRSPSISSL